MHNRGAVLPPGRSALLGIFIVLLVDVWLWRGSVQLQDVSTEERAH